MTSKIPINRVGKILAGDNVGGYVKILDDSERTGGFLVLTSSRKDFHTGGDDWVEDYGALEKYISESGWLIEWI
jgi:hypothetical protein